MLALLVRFAGPFAGPPYGRRLKPRLLGGCIHLPGWPWPIGEEAPEPALAGKSAAAIFRGFWGRTEHLRDVDVHGLRLPLEMGHGGSVGCHDAIGQGRDAA